MQSCLSSLLSSLKIKSFGTRGRLSNLTGSGKVVVVVGAGEKAEELILGPPLRSYAAGMMQASTAGASHVLMNSSQVIFLWNSPEHPSTHGRLAHGPCIR